MRFADFADGPFHLPVGLGQNLLRFALGLVEDVFLQGLDLAQFFLILVREAFERLVGALDTGQFLVEDPAAAGNLPQVALDVHIFAAGPFFGILDYVGRQPHLAGQLEGERVAGHPLLQLEQRLDGRAVEEHRAVDHARALVRIEFEIGVVGGDHAIGAHLVEPGQHGFGDGAACGRFCAAAELVDQHER